MFPTKLPELLDYKVTSVNPSLLISIHSDEELERALISTILAKPSSACYYIFNDKEDDSVNSRIILESDDFNFASNKAAFDGIKGILTENRDIRRITPAQLRSEVPELKTLIPKLFINSDANPETFSDLVKRIRNLTVKRRATKFALSMLHAVNTSTEDGTVTVEETKDNFDSLVSWSNGLSIPTFFDGTVRLNSYVERLEKQAKEGLQVHKDLEEVGTVGVSTRRRRICKTGLIQLDGGSVYDPDLDIEIKVPRRWQLRPGSASCILADTSVGKTLLLMQIVWHNLKLGNKFLVFLNENTEQEIMDRLFCSKAFIDYEDLQSYRDCGEGLTPEDLIALRNVQKQYQSYTGKVDFVEAFGWSGERIKAYAMERDERLYRLTGRGYDGIGVDYLQKMAANKSVGYGKKDMTLIVDDNITTMSLMALQMKCHVIVTSQVRGRDTISHEEERIVPNLHSALWGSAVAHRVPNVIGLWRSFKKEDNNKSLIKILKRSSGVVNDVVECRFEPGRYEFI